MQALTHRRFDPGLIQPALGQHLRRLGVFDVTVRQAQVQHRLEDVFAGEKLAQAGDKFKELQNKDPKELVEDAKEFARQKPGQTILISAAIGMVIGFLLKGRK